jgi:hypothetical protein
MRDDSSAPPHVTLLTLSTAVDGIRLLELERIVQGFEVVTVEGSNVTFSVDSAASPTNPLPLRSTVLLATEVTDSTSRHGEARRLT